MCLLDLTIIDYLKDILEVINKFFSVGLLVISIIVALKGLGKVSEFLKLYRDRHMSAIYGFYSNVHTNCIVLKDILNAGKEYWDALSGTTLKDLKKDTDKSALINSGYILYEEDLKKAADNILILFKSEKNQTLPENDPDNWEILMHNFQEKLSKLRFIGEFDNEWGKFKAELEGNLEEVITRIRAEKLIIQKNILKNSK